MTNEEAKRLYGEAQRCFKERDYIGALERFDALDAERPNSRHVNYNRALCLIELGRAEEAEQCYFKLEGRIEEDSLRQLKEAIQTAKSPRRSRMSKSHFEGTEEAPAAGDSFFGGASGFDHAATEPNAFVVQSSFPVSTDECSVLGHVKKGVFHVGDITMVLSPVGDRITAPVVRIGPAETPINFAREGQRVMMVLRVDPAQVGAGATIIGETRISANAATMIAPSPSKNAQSVMERPPELIAVERQIKQGDYAEAERQLNAYLMEHRNNAYARRLLAQVYLDAPAPLRSPDKALGLIRSVFEAGNEEEPGVIYVMAQAFAETGDSGMGLRYIERLYNASFDPDARRALAQRVHDFRARYGMGNVWEFADESGEVLFESADGEEMLNALRNGVFPEGVQCRRNHVGMWEPLDAGMFSAYPEIVAFLNPKQKIIHWSPEFIALLALLCLGIVLAWFLPQILAYFNPPPVAP